MLSVLIGRIQYIIVGKYPREVENSLVGEGLVSERLFVKLLSSNVMANPAMVTSIMV